LHYAAADNLWELAVGGTNLTNERYPTAGSPNTGSGEVGAYWNPPRQWYVTLSMKLSK
jgi:iron complex outermembrane receptor protein